MDMRVPHRRLPPRRRFQVPQLQVSAGQCPNRALTSVSDVEGEVPSFFCNGKSLNSQGTDQHSSTQNDQQHHFLHFLTSFLPL